MFRVVRIIVNSFTFVLLLIIAYIMWQSNPLFSILIALAAIDQFEDVYYYTYMKRLFPSWFMPIDIVLEMVIIGIGIGMLLFSIIYYAYFETWFFRAILLLSIPVIYSAVEDITTWITPPPVENPKPTISGMVMQYVYPKEEGICEEKRFVRRK